MPMKMFGQADEAILDRSELLNIGIVVYAAISLLNWDTEYTAYRTVFSKDWRSCIRDRDLINVLSTENSINLSCCDILSLSDSRFPSGVVPFPHNILARQRTSKDCQHRFK